MHGAQSHISIYRQVKRSAARVDGELMHCSVITYSGFPTLHFVGYSEYVMTTPLARFNTRSTTCEIKVPAHGGIV